MCNSESNHFILNPFCKCSWTISFYIHVYSCLIRFSNNTELKLMGVTDHKIRKFCGERRARGNEGESGDLGFYEASRNSSRI
jgi:hypothetical protein